MSRTSRTASVSGSSLNTLAQTGTTYSPTSTEKPAVIISGDGSEISSNPQSKAKRKMISQKLAMTLAQVAKEQGEQEKRKAFWNTYYCQSRLYSFEGRLYGRYCKNRHCTLCSSIRKAKIINDYLPVMQTWKQPYFVTLTVKAHPKEDLRKLCRKVLAGFQLITSRYRKRNQRGKGVKLIGVKSLECNFNAVKKTYNPHLHLIVASKEIAEILIKEWLLTWGKNLATRRAQHYRPVGNLECDLIETAKYGSKIFTEPDVTQKSNAKGNREIYAAALYNIFKAMQGLRIFERFGFDLPAKERKTAAARIVTAYYEWEYVAQYNDWLNTDNDLTLTGYNPHPELANLLQYSIDRKSD